MRYFHRPITVNIDGNILDRANQFAARVTATVGTPGQGYRDSKQFNLDKIRQDHAVSKIGEEAVKAVFQRYNQPVQGPDYRIYAPQAKSWAADLVVAGVELAVKTQRLAIAQQFGLSWTFQAGTHRRDPILQHPQAWVCFVLWDADQGCCTVYPPYQIQELTFEEPKLARLRGQKKVVYAKNLPPVGK